MAALEVDRVMQLFQAADYEPRAYSGRGMYDKECLGISCKNPIEAVLDVIWQADDILEVEQLVEALRGSQTDQLGMGKILYFPRLEWVNA